MSSYKMKLGGDAKMNEVDKIKEVEDREQAEKEKIADETLYLNYVGDWTHEGIHTLSGLDVGHGDLWDIFSRYKYMCKLANIPDPDGNCVFGYSRKKVGRLLELGADWGHCWNVFEYIAEEVYGVEIAEWAVKKGRLEGRNIHHSRLEHTLFDDNFFDIVCSNHVLEHAETPDMALKELSRITKSGGYSAHTLPITLNNQLEEECVLHPTRMLQQDWIDVFVKHGFEITNSFFMWNHNQEDWTLIARKK